MKKVTILMPTYNDCKMIKKSLASVSEQIYTNWELLICDDGSTDNTKQVIEQYIKKNNLCNKIKYFYQTNSDQLNALITLMPHITGDYVYILHSDDLLYDENVLEKMVSYMENHPKLDAIMGDISIIDKDDNQTSTVFVQDYENRKQTIALQLLWLGRNLYTDMAFHTKESFMNQVYNNYLLWNGPFWLNIDSNTMLNVEKVDFPFFKYRVFEENYLNNKGANLNVINGEIRVVTRLLNNYYIPLYKLQYLFFRVFNRLKLNKHYRPFYNERETKNKYKIIKFVLSKRFTEGEIKNNLFLNSLVLFYKNIKKRAINIDMDNINKLFYGKDMRLFNRAILDNNLEEEYLRIFNEMQEGFDEIIIDDEKQYNKAIDLTKFLCIYPYVKIIVRGENNEK